jgi:hypothetical protein
MDEVNARDAANLRFLRPSLPKAQASTKAVRSGVLSASLRDDAFPGLRNRAIHGFA